MIHIEGSHRFSCDYVFSNIYGESVFFDEDDISLAEPPVLSPQATEWNLMDTLPQTPMERMTTLPLTDKQVSYCSSGTVLRTEHDGIFIRYGTDDNPICIHVVNKQYITVTNDNTDYGEIVFEENVRHCVALQSSAFEDFPVTPGDFDECCGVNLGIKATDIQVNFTRDGMLIKIQYTIDVNGYMAESTCFTLKAKSMLSRHTPISNARRTRRAAVGKER